jgi:hypothetical protein
MVIEWKQPSELDRFSDNGDSGSLVYAIHDGYMVTLGIHFASDEDRYESYTHLLWYWCDTMERSLDFELLCCDIFFSLSGSTHSFIFLSVFSLP